MCAASISQNVIIWSNFDEKHTHDIHTLHVYTCDIHTLHVYTWWPTYATGIDMISYICYMYTRDDLHMLQIYTWWPTYVTCIHVMTYIRYRYTHDDPHMLQVFSYDLHTLQVPRPPHFIGAHVIHTAHHCSRRTPLFALHALFTLYTLFHGTRPCSRWIPLFTLHAIVNALVHAAHPCSRCTPLFTLHAIVHADHLCLHCTMENCHFRSTSC